MDLGKAIMENFGFGDFVMRDPNTGKEFMRVRNLVEMQKNIFKIPDDVLYYHCSRNDLSRWFYSRAMFPIADVIKDHRFMTMDEAPKVRQLIFDLIVKYRKMKKTDKKFQI